jgi:hypothetical protein
MRSEVATPPRSRPAVSRGESLASTKRADAEYTSANARQPARRPYESTSYPAAVPTMANETKPARNRAKMARWESGVLVAGSSLEK